MIINVMIDFCFLIDFMYYFVTAYECPKSGLIETRLGKIFRNLLGNPNFYLDLHLLAVLPVDLIQLVHSHDVSVFTKLSKALRVFKLLSLIRVSKVVQVLVFTPQMFHMLQKILFKTGT